MLLPSHCLQPAGLSRMRWTMRSGARMRHGKRSVRFESTDCVQPCLRANFLCLQGDGHLTPKPHCLQVGGEPCCLPGYNLTGVRALRRPICACVVSYQHTSQHGHAGHTHAAGNHAGRGPDDQFRYGQACGQCHCVSLHSCSEVHVA